MKNIKFLREPGFIRDLFFLFILKFNKEYCICKLMNYNKAENDREFFNKILLEFEEIPDELLLFFYLRGNKQSFITTFYYIPFAGNLTTSFNLDVIESALVDYDTVITNLMKFYFVTASDSDISQARNSLKKTGELIKNSDYNCDIKSALYSFFIDPIPFIQKLSHELLSKSLSLSQFYNKNMENIDYIQNNIKFDELSAKLKMLPRFEMNIDDVDDIYISFSCIWKNGIDLYLNEDKTVLILGTDYNDHLDYKMLENVEPDLSAFGAGIAEKNRIDILDFMLRKDEVTIRDVEQELGFTGTNSYYHISLLLNTGMINTRNEGRTVFYSLNKSYFSSVYDLIEKYLK